MPSHDVTGSSVKMNDVDRNKRGLRTALMLADTLLHSGWDVDEVSTFITAVMSMGDDEETTDRLHIVGNSVEEEARGEPADPVLSADEVLEFCEKRFKKKISLRTLARMRENGRGPKFMRLGKTPVYRLSWLYEWAEAQVEHRNPRRRRR